VEQVTESEWKVDGRVNVVQDGAGGTTTVHAKNVRVAKVSARFVTLETGEVFVASTGYVRGARRTRGVGRSHERRIEAVN